jgi:hypothetical protein
VNNAKSCFPASQAVVVVNATPQAQSFADPAFQGKFYFLHPVQALSSDPVTRTSRFKNGAFQVPARTTAVFLAPCGR